MHLVWLLKFTKRSLTTINEIALCRHSYFRLEFFQANRQCFFSQQTVYDTITVTEQQWAKIY